MIRKRDNYTKTTDQKSKSKYLMPFYNINDFYRRYRGKLKGKKNIDQEFKDIKYKEFRDILDDYNKALLEEIVSGKEVNLPRIGSLTIKKKWVPNDIYSESAKKHIFAGGKWIMRVKFKKDRYRIKNISLYSFRLTKSTIIRIQNIFHDLDGHKKYLEL